MKKLFLCLLMIASAFGIQCADAQTIKDTIVADGYYRIANNFYGSGTSMAGRGYVYLGDAGAVSTRYAGWLCTFIGTSEKVTNNDWIYVWHIWRDASGKYHMKNCGNQANTYLYPTKMDCVQSDYIYACGVDHDTYTFRTQDYGSSTSASKCWQGILNKLQTPLGPTATYIKNALKNNRDTSEMCFNKNKMMFIVPASNAWRFRIGDDNLVKLNSYNSVYHASWWLEPVDMTGKLEWMHLNEAITDAKGQYFEVGNNPGNVPADKADILETLENALTEATAMYNEGATDEEYIAETKKVREATEAVAAVTNKIDGYYYLRDHYDQYGGGLAKYASFFNDFKYRHYVLSTTTKEDYYPDDSLEIKVRTHNWMPEGLWFGYSFVYDADPSETTAEKSALPDRFIWHITQREDGSYTMKNCAPSEECHDSTYYYSYIDRLSSGASAFEQFPMCGTPNQGTNFTHVQGNQYWITQTDNWYPLNQGDNYFCTANAINTMTYCLWELEKVNDARITSKFKLNEAITDAGGLCKGYRWGNNPGEVSEEYITELKAELAKAREVYANPTASDNDCDNAAAALKAIYEPTLKTLQDTDNVMNKIEDGYYRFYNTDYLPDFNEHYQAISETLSSGTGNIFHKKDVPTGEGTHYDYFSDKDGNFYWEYQSKYALSTDYDTLKTENGSDSLAVKYVKDWNESYLPMDIYRTWKITDMNTRDSYGRELYTVQNLGNGYYLRMPKDGEKTQVKMSEEVSMVALDNNNQEKVTFNTYWLMNTNMFRNKGWWQLFAPDRPGCMACHDNLGSSGQVSDLKAGFSYMYYTATYMFTLWFRMQKIEGSVLDSLLAVGEANQHVIHIGTEIARAQGVLDRTINYTIGDSLLTCAGNGEYADKNGDGVLDTVIDYDREANQVWMNQTQLDEGIPHLIYTDPDGTNHYSVYDLFSYNALIDGNLSTFVESRWTISATSGPAAECTEFNAIVCDLKDKPQSNIVFKWGGRGNYNELYGPIGQRPITYGTTFYGYNYRPVDLRVYGTNDTLKGWNEVKLIKDIPIVNNQIVYTSPLIQADSTYRFYKVACEKNVSGSHYLGHPTIAVSYFQVFEANVDEANSPATYLPEVKEKADALKAAITAAKNAQISGTVDGETVTALQEAKEACDAVTPNTWPLLKEYIAAKELADSVYIDESEEELQYGNVLEGDKDEINAALENALAQMNPETHATLESIDEAIQALKTAEANLTMTRKTFEPDKWYYIKSTEYQNYHYKDNFDWRGGHLVYACGDIPQTPLKDRTMGNIASPIRWGHYVHFKCYNEAYAYPKDYSVATTYTDQAGTERTYYVYPNYMGGSYDNVADPHEMWRFVPMTDSTYAVQNRANGLYLGRMQDYTSSTYYYATLSVEPMQVKINLLGQGQFEIVPCDSALCHYSAQADKADKKTGKYPSVVYESEPLHSWASDFHLAWWGTTTERGYNTASSYTFVPVDDDEMLGEGEWLSMACKDNAVQTVSLPYAIDFESMGELSTDGVGNAQTYTVNSIEGRKVNFEKKDKFEAGEPFILVTGNPSTAIKDAALDSCNIWIDPTCITDASGNVSDEGAFEYSFENKNANGLYAALLGDSILADKSTYNKYGVIADAVGQITDSTKNVYIPGQGAYFVMAEIPTDVTATDYEFTFNGNGDFTSGDVNADGKVSVGDLTLLINMIMTEYATQDDAFNAADMNGDGKLSVGDITLIVNTIMNGSKAYVAGTETAATYIDPEKNYITCETPDLTLDKDETAQFQIGITNSEEITGMQFDLYLPYTLEIDVDSKGRFKKGFTSNERTTADYHTLTVSKLSNGAYRFLMYSSSNETIDGNSGAVIYCTVKCIDGCTTKLSAIAKDITLSNPDGAMAEMAEKVLTENITGINGVTSAKADGTYFNAQGQKTNGAQKGVNIVKYNNGKTVKVVK